MKNLLPLLITFFLFSFSLCAQDYVLLTGKVVDKVTKEAILYAHIGIPEKGIGTTSGHGGNFTFKVPRQYANSTLMVSFMGYKTFRQSINTISVPFRIELERAHHKLTEIVVTDGNEAVDIIRKAVRAIPKNYPSHPTRHLAFYRESCTDDSLRYRYMAEGVINVYKKSYTSKKEGQVSLVQGRRMNLRNPLDTIIRGGLGSGHMAAHRFDVVENREDFLNESYFPVYKYWIEKTTTYNDNPVYVIAFAKDENPKKSAKRKQKTSDKLDGLINVFRKKKKNKKTDESAKARLEGRVFIDMKTYAIIRAEFKVTKEGLKKSNAYPLYAGNWRSNTYIVNYRQLGNKWYFSDALREGNLRGEIYNNEIKITEINAEKAEPLPYLERLHRSQNFTRLTGTYDPNFWASYNTVPLSEALTERVRQIENNKKAEEIFRPERMLVLQQQRDSIRVEKEREMAAIDLNINEDDDDELAEFDFSEIRRNKKRRRRSSSFNVLLGLGTHLIHSKEEGLNLTYLSKDNETILSLGDNIPQRRFEVISNLDFDIYFRRNYFIRLGMNWDYLNSIYKDRSIGVGGAWNLSKQRPIYFKAIAQYDNLKYARKLGVANNDFGKFKVRGKKFNAKSVNVYYGSRTHNLKLSTELSIELKPDREFYVRGTYFLPFAQREDIWLKERRQVLKKKRSIPLDRSEVILTQNGIPLDNEIPANTTFSISIGFLFK